MRALIGWYLSGALLVASVSLSHAQNSSVSIGTETLKDKAVLWLKATGNQGLLLPVVADKDNFTGLNSSDEKGMIVFDASENKIYYWNGTTWIEAGGTSGGSNQTLTFSGNTFTLTGSPGSTVPLASNTPSTGQALVWTGSAWAATSLVGDVSGAVSTTQVTGIRGKAIPALPNTTQVLVYNGTDWQFQTLTGGTDSQDLSLSGTTLSLTNDATPVNLGGLAILSAVNSATITDGSIQNADIANTTITGQKLAAMGATDGQVLKFTTVGGWAPAADAGGTTYTAGTGIGIAAGVITNTGDTDATNDLTTASVAAGDVTGPFSNLQIAANAVTATEIANATITGQKLNAMGATDGQVMKYTTVGGWAPAADAGGTTYTAGTGIGIAAGVITNTGDTDASNDLTTANVAAGDVTGTFSNLQIAANAVTNTEIADVAPAKLTQSAAATGEVLKWNGTAWAPAPDAGGTTYTGGTGISVAGSVISNTGDTNAADDLTTASTAAGDVTGPFSNLQIAANAVTNTEIANMAPAKLTQSAANTNDVLKWNGTSWAPAPDAGGTTYTGGTGISVVGSVISNTGDTNAADDLTTASTAGGDVTGPFSNLQIAANTITTTEITDGTVRSTDLEDGGIQAVDLNAMGATNGQVLGYTGTSWGPVTAATNFTNTNVVPKGSATGLVPSLLFDDGTNVGIGTTTPGANLELVAASPTLRIRSSGNSSSLVFVNSGGTIGSIGDPGSSEDLEVVATNRLFFNTNFATRAAIDNNGRFGIGTITPTEVVDVVGNIKFSGALMPNNLPGTAGQVLTSAGPGLPPVWSASGNFVRTSATNNLFVGTSNGATTTGSSNTFVGESSGQANTTGGQNTFVGTLAGSQNTIGLRNTFLGESAGLKNNNDFNTFLGQNAGRENVSGRANVAVGVNSMQANIAGIDQVVIGVNAMLLNTGTENTSIGGGSLRNITASDRNTALGYHAGNAVTTGSFHTFLGESSDASAGLTNSTAIGAKAYVTQSNSMVLGSINGVNGATSNTNVGIGTSAPTEALHVVGNLRFSGALLPNNDAGTAGQVLISAGPGLVPTWGTVGAALINNTGTRNLFAGSSVSTASTDNAIFGSSAGSANTGPYNVIVGTYAARLKTTGSLNTIVGWAAGENSSANGNTFIGAEAGRAATTLNISTFVGEKAGLAISTGTSNIMIGNSAGSATTSGNYNVFLGNNSGDTNLTGSSLTLLGRNTDVVGTALTNATAIGADATVSASNALVLGNNANVGIGITAPTTDLHIVHANGSPAAGDGLTIQNVGANNHAWNFFVSNTSGNLILYKNTALRGQWDATGGTYTASDRRLKKNITDVDGILSDLMNVKIHRYHFKTQQDSEYKKFGVIAQEIQEVFPELVSYAQEADTYTVDYLSLAPIAVKAIQEQQVKIQSLEAQVAELESKIKTLSSTNEQMDIMLRQLAADVAAIKAQNSQTTAAVK